MSRQLKQNLPINVSTHALPSPSEVPFGGLTAAGLILDTAYQGIDSSEWQDLFHKAREADVSGLVAKMFAGKAINASENRAVLHTALRNLTKTPVQLNGADVMPAIAEVWQRIAALCNKWVGITDVIHIGIGGSDFGPRLVVQALAHVAPSRSMRMHFVANVDSAELAQILESAQPHSTRIIIVSKSFTTLETMMNAKTVVNWLKTNNLTKSQIENALIGVTTNVPAAKSFGLKPDNIYPFWDWVGGRFSVWSAVGLPIALQYGFDTFQNFLAGASAMDQHFINAPAEQNLPLIMALALHYQQTKHQVKSIAVIPYAHALELFPFWLQQLDMESNGKSVDRNGKEVTISSPVVFGSAGSNAQHSYFQLLHQGTEIIPVDFIAVAKPMSKLPEALEHHQALLANCLAQAQALANGKQSNNAAQSYPGKRPSNLVLLPKLDAYHLGALLALYENRAVCLGALWNLNSFDQPGVELGKVLARPIEAAFAATQDGIDAAAEQFDTVTAKRIAHLKEQLSQ